MSHDIASLVPAFCAAFLKQSEFETAGLAYPALVPAGLDYTVDSLHLVDSYLEAVRAGQSAVPHQTYTNTVLAAGSYLGETIRRHARRKLAWKNYADYFPAHPKLKDIVPENLGSSAVLLADDGTMTMPINKIIRFIREGPVNSTHFYAAAEVRE